MSTLTSLLQDLLQTQPHLRSQVYFKSSLVALSHAMEDQILSGFADHSLFIASFQREQFYRQEAHRYHRIAEHTDQAYVLSAPESDFKHHSGYYETIAFDPSDALSQEWHLVIVGQQYSACLLCREKAVSSAQLEASHPSLVEQSRRFEGIWTFDRQVSSKAAQLLLQRILVYRPELTSKVEQALTQLATNGPSGSSPVDPDPFAQRLVNYLQAGQYKLLRAYRSITAQERKERLVNSITSAIRRSLNPDKILTIAAQELGQALQSCRCLIYCCKATDATATLQHEYLGSKVMSLAGQTWPLQENPLFQAVVQTQAPVYLKNTHANPHLTATSLQTLVKQAAIHSWLIVPVLYQGRLLGILELHNCSAAASDAWDDEDLSLVEAIATQVGVTLIQAQAYADMEDLNRQLEALERTRSNLIAVTGHELRTPLSTIQVCLESLASEPDMSLELRQVMLSTALGDSERLRTLVQDFLTLSQLESSRVEWHLEALPLNECVELALSNTRARWRQNQLPQITTHIPSELPPVQVDGEWLVEALAKLIDNACKFTDSQGTITIQAQCHGDRMIEVTVADTGRGIEPDSLKNVFDRFYQEEGALRRTTGGTGLGLAICRQIVMALGGEIWAESPGKNQGSQFHFTLPSVNAELAIAAQAEQDGHRPVGSHCNLRATLR